MILTKDQLTDLLLINVHKEYLLKDGICDDEIYFVDPKPLFSDLKIADYVRGCIPGVVILRNDVPIYFIYVHDLSNWGVLDHILILSGHDYVLLVSLLSFNYKKVCSYLDTNVEKGLS